MTNIDINMTIIHLCHSLALTYQHKSWNFQFEDRVLTDDATIGAATRHRKLTTLFETVGSVLAMVYAISIALNIGAEVIGFSLLLVSACLFAGWAILDRRWTFLLLQGFYAASAIIGLFRWG